MKGFPDRDPVSPHICAASQEVMPDVPKVHTDCRPWRKQPSPQPSRGERRGPANHNPARSRPRCQRCLLVDPSRWFCTITVRCVRCCCRPPTPDLRPRAELGPFRQVLTGWGCVSARFVPVSALKRLCFPSHEKTQIHVHPQQGERPAEKDGACKHPHVCGPLREVLYGVPMAHNCCRR